MTHRPAAPRNTRRRAWRGAFGFEFGRGTAMPCSSHTLALLALVAVFSATGGPARALTVDDFTTSQSMIFDATRDGAGVASQVAGAMLGGWRDIYLNRTAGGGDGFDLSEIVTARVGPDRLFSMSTPNAVTGVAILRWDGDNGSGSASTMQGLGLAAALAAVNPGGLGGVDLVGSGAGLRLLANNDLAYSVQMLVYTSATQWSTQTLSYAAAPVDGRFGASDFLFDAFGPGAGAAGPADFSNVGAVQMVVNTGGVAGLDVNLSLVTVAAVPEAPAAAMFAAGGLALWGWLAATSRRRLRRRVAFLVSATTR